MRWSILFLSLVLGVSSLQAQTSYECPSTYAFNWADLEWYDVEDVFYNDLSDECESSSSGLYFGYSTAPSTGHQPPPNCACNEPNPPLEVMIVGTPTTPRTVATDVINKGVYDKNTGLPPTRLIVFFDKLIIESLDPSGNERYYLCMSAFDKQQGRPLIKACEVAKPKDLPTISIPMVELNDKQFALRLDTSLTISADLKDDDRQRQTISLGILEFRLQRPLAQPLKP